MRNCNALVAVLAAVLVVPVFAAGPCCEEQDFQGIGQSPEGIKIQLVEVKRTSPKDVQVTWTIRNTTSKPQVLTKGTGAAWSDPFKLSYDANLLDTASRLKIKVAKATGGGGLIAARHVPDHRAGGIVVGAGKTITTWAKFVVPENTTQVTVDLPGATKPWESIPIAPQTP